jgi:acyl-CoA oxidase
LKLIYALWTTALLDAGIGVKTFLHYFLYTKTLILFQNHPKHQELIDNALALRDLGCFGLTEFHHGSYSKEVQTLSTYDHQAKEFVLTTQGQKGMKYWIGAAS